jgi:hypothetical protein
MDEGVIEMDYLPTCRHERRHGDLGRIGPARQHIVIGATVGLKVDGEVAHRIFFLLA